jgi:hypothetical protein
MIVMIERNSVIFTYSVIIEGATENLLQFKMPLKSIWDKTLVSLNKNVFSTARWLKPKNIFIITLFCNKTFVLFTFSELPPIGLYLYNTKILNL